MGQYNRSDDRVVGEAVGCVIWAAIVAAIFGILELLRPRPQIYDPQGVDTPYHSRANDRLIISWPVLGVMGVLSLSFCACPILDLASSNPQEGMWPFCCGMLGIILLPATLIMMITNAVNTAAVGGQTQPQVALPPQTNPQKVIAATAQPSQAVAPTVPMMTIYRITPKFGTAFNPAACQKLVYSLLEVCPQLIFQIEGYNEETVWQVVDIHSQYPDQQILHNLKTHYPDAMVELLSSPEIEPDSFTPFYRGYVVFGLNNEYVAPLPFVDMLKHDDPLIPLTKRMDFLRTDSGERITYSLISLTETRDAVEVGRERLQYEHILYLSSREVVQGVIPLDDKVVASKRIHKHYHTFLIVCIESQQQERVYELRSAVYDVTQFSRTSYNQIVERLANEVSYITSLNEASTRSLAAIVYKWSSNLSDTWRDALMVLTPPEMAALWHLPDERFGALLINWNTRKEVPLPKPLHGVKEGILLGVNRFGGEKRPVYLPLEDRATHLAMFGRTGTGKSSLMLNMILEDIYQGRGVCVIDPHGLLVSWILQSDMPSHREQELVILDVANELDGEHYPPPFNFLLKPKQYGGANATGTIMSILEKNYDNFAGTRMAYLLKNALIALYSQPNPTLMDVPMFLQDPIYRREVVSQVRIPAIKQAWERFEGRSADAQDEMVFPLLQKLDAFYTNPHLMAMTCHPHPLDLRELMAENKIILISLGGEHPDIPGDEQAILGGIIAAQVYMAAMSGAIKTTPYMLYIDEADAFTDTRQLPEMLSKVRKYGLGMVMATQYLNQLMGKTLQAVEGNVGAFIAFEVGQDDASVLAKYMQPDYTADDLMGLGEYSAAVSIRYRGTRLPAFSLNTLPPSVLQVPPTRATKRELTRRQVSMKKYSPLTYNQVRDELNYRYDTSRDNLQPPQSFSTDKNWKDDDEFIE